MKTKILCSHCNHSINVGEDIVLVAKNAMGEKGLVFLHSKLGNYTSKFSSEFNTAEGESIRFSCPICHDNLTNLKNEKLADVILVDENNKRFQITFSKIYGEHCTYKIEEDVVMDTYGQHWSLYQSPDWFQFF